MRFECSEDCRTYSCCQTKDNGMPMQEVHRLRAELADVKQKSDQQKQRLRNQLQSLQHSLDQARAQNTALENRLGCMHCIATLVHALLPWGCSSHGGALALHARGTGFDSLHLQDLPCPLTTYYFSARLLRRSLMKGRRPGMVDERSMLTQSFAAHCFHRA